VPEDPVAYPYVDLSHPLHHDTPTFPGAPRVRVDVLERCADRPSKGRRSLNISLLSMMVHTATHMDAPFHFFETGCTIEQIPLDRCIGTALLVDVSRTGPREEIHLREIPGLREKLHDVKKVVLNTGWAAHWGQTGYFTDHPRLTDESARFLLECGVHLVGIDAPSVDRQPFPAHLELLGNGCVIVENLTNLSTIDNERFHLTVLPLLIVGRDGSPVRAVATRL
jgi:arylformamidase